MSNQWHGMRDNFTPLHLLFLPHHIPSLLAILQTIVAPNMFDIVQITHLRKHAHEGFGVLVVSHPNGLGPVVAPLHHGAGFEVVVPQLVDVAIGAHVGVGPVPEFHHVFIVSVSQKGQ